MVHVLFLLVYKRRLFRLITLLLQQIYGLLKPLLSFSSRIKFLKWDKIPGSR